MAKNLGAKGKLVRRFGYNIFGSAKYDRLLERRSHGPGQHGPSQARRKISSYGLQLMEKQKLRNSYNLLEKQFRRAFNKAQRMPGVTGDNLMVLLETRLDSIAFRAGLGSTIMQARQIVNHGHLEVNNQKVDIPSYRVKPGDVISVRNRTTSQDLGKRVLGENPRFYTSDWLTVNQEELKISVSRWPLRNEIQNTSNEKMIVELYSK